MPSPERSYTGYAEDYTVRVEADRPLLEMASVQVHKALDLGTGTGTGIEDLIDMKVLVEPFTVIGIDLDEHNLEKARKNLSRLINPRNENHIILQKGNIENLEGIESNSQELILCRNTIHLTNASRVFSEMYRVIEPGGTILVSSGYMSDKMYPPPEERAKIRWGLILGLARQKLVKEHGYEKSQIPDPNLPDKYSSVSLMRLAREAGFINSQTEDRIIELGATPIAGLIKFDSFAEGAIPIEDIELAKKVMLEALENPKLQGKTFPRGIFYLKANKPLSVSLYPIR